MINTLEILKYYVSEIDTVLVSWIKKSEFTSNLLSTEIGKYITEIIIISSFILLTYEVCYWSGIYMGLWEYHAKDIFTEIPVHCAHVYVRVNVCRKQHVKELEQFYVLKSNAKYNILYWSELTKIARKIFERKQFVKYHFEFGPDDYEMNEEPEYGSTIKHLRNKVLTMFQTSALFTEYQSDSLTDDNILIYNRKDTKIDHDKDNEYLSKCYIETGNVIDCIVVI